MSRSSSLDPAPTSLPPSSAPPQFLNMAEVLGALSYALDLTEGAAPGHTLRTCVIGMRLADALALPPDDRTALYYALLLKDAGCSSNAARICALFGSDDHTIKPRLKLVDENRRGHVALETFRNAGVGEPIWSRMRSFLRVARTDNVTHDLIQVRCERGADIARRLGFPEAAADAIHALDEHWNGRGHPEGLAGEAIPLLARIMNIAQTAEVFHRDGGVEAVRAVMQERSGTWFDPRLAREVIGWSGDRVFWEQLFCENPQEIASALEPQHDLRVLDESGLELVARAFADIIDAKTPFTYRHSSNVAAFASAIAEQFTTDPTELRRMRCAGLLHDVGKLGVSNRILDKNGPLDTEERAAVEAHPRFTWEILSRIDAFRDFAWLASVHHEKLDGSGYPWKLGADRLDDLARILVVADIYEALTADRPYRAGMTPEAAIAILERDRDRKLWGPAIDALAAAMLSREGGAL
jgi:HD-GYP domain-containing protein (c-di-GMP phosphodiesterase class II)